MQLADLHIGDCNRPGAVTIRVWRDPQDERHLLIDLFPAEDQYRPTTVTVCLRQETVLDTREEKA